MAYHHRFVSPVKQRGDCFINSSIEDELFDYENNDDDEIIGDQSDSNFHKWSIKSCQLPISSGNSKTNQMGVNKTCFSKVDKNLLAVCDSLLLFRFKFNYLINVFFK